MKDMAKRIAMRYVAEIKKGWQAPAIGKNGVKVNLNDMYSQEEFWDSEAFRKECYEETFKAIIDAGFKI